jgi:two-component system response regulator AtoC
MTRGSVVPAPSRGIRVLVVDDEPAICRMFSTALKQDGYTALAAGSAEEALRILSREPVDVVVSDVHMPGADGLTLLRQVRARHPRIAFIVVTGRPSRAMEGVVIEAGAHLMLKPVMPETLRNAIGRALAPQLPI